MQNSPTVVSFLKDIFYILTMVLGILGTAYGYSQKKKNKEDKTLIETITSKIKDEVTPIITKLDMQVQTTETMRKRDEATTYCTLALCKNALYNGDAKNEVKTSMSNLEKILNTTICGKGEC